MPSKLVNLRWAKKISVAKFFVAATEKESAIAVDGMDPSSFNDVLALQEQRASLVDFRDRLTDLIERHDLALADLKVINGITAETRREKTTTKSKTAKASKAKPGRSKRV